jgi:hypothetical protein
MKTKYPRFFGLLAAVLLVASFVVPVSLMNPAPVEAGVCKWDTTMTPGYLPLKNDIGLYAPHDMVVGGDGATVLIAARYALPDLLPTVPAGGVVYSALFWTNNGGISFSGTKYTSFADAFWTLNGIATPAPLTRWPNVYLAAIAPDNPNFWAIVTDRNQGDVALTYTPQEVWVTTNAGGKWECTQIGATLLAAGETIRTIDISVDYGGKRDIAIGTVDGAGGGDVYTVPSTGFAGWKAQTFALGDFYAVKFSPTYPSDASLAVVYAESTTATGGATWYNISQRDIDQNIHLAWALAAVEVKDSTWDPGDSPGIDVLNRADLELPSDFSGQAASLRRAYISLDAYTGSAKTDQRDGIFRIDDTTVYTLMDTNIVEKSIYSIAYFGTYASGKLLAGERRGSPCTATVPTWFTDSPTTCPVPCWYPALKPTTGAAGLGSMCPAYDDGGALVGWRADGNIAYALTGSYPVKKLDTWYEDWVVDSGYYGLVLYDESAFAISRNNGETWNQIALINTKINNFSDVAPTPDCKTIYLASVNLYDAYGTGYRCGGFDSVWRTSSNTEVVSPYPALPVGIFWERVLTRVTSASCNVTQTNHALLRIVPYCADPSGQIVAWGVYDTNQIATRGTAAWSPDYGDYWANITVRDPIQDFTFESSTVMYFLSPDGPVQKMPYTGTAWSTTLSSVDPVIYGAHTIAAYPEGKVLVGAATAYHSTLYAVSYAGNFNTDNPSFTVQSMAGRTTFYGDVHVAFHPAFKDNNTYFIDDTGAAGGSVYRNSAAAQQRWADTDMMDAANGAIGCPAPIQEPQYGLVLAFTGEALYSAGFDASDNTTGVWRTIGSGSGGTGKYGPLSGMPKPGIAWDRLTVGLEKAPLFVKFTLQPSSLKACGCCTLETDTTLYAIDNAAYNATTHVLWNLPFTTIPAVTQSGLLWAFTDCVAKKGPALITADKTLIGCDPVSGRAQEVNLCWEQLCVASEYDIEIAKSAEFTIKVLDWVAESTCGGLRPADITAPCAYIPAGGSFAEDAESDEEAMGSAVAFYGQLECGHTYYWRVKVRECATGQDIRSPWSEVRSFTVKAGLPVSTPYYGVQLLAPNNGGLGIPVKPVSFSWSPFKETTKYKFVLAKDAAMTQVVKEADVTTTAFEYDGALDYSTNYFWRVMSVEPAPSDWSATFSFLTEAAPAAAPGPTPAPPTPMWVWVVIALGAILVIVTLVLIFKTRRV